MACLKCQTTQGGFCEIPTTLERAASQDAENPESTGIRADQDE